MAIADFRKQSKKGEAPPEEPQKQTAVEVVDPPSMEVGAHQPENTDSQSDGEFNSSDILYPFLSCVSQSSECVGEHPEWIGKLLLDKKYCLGPSVPVIVTKRMKRYEEVVEFGAGIIPMRWKTVAEAEAWQEKEGGEFIEVGTLDLLVEVPDSLPLLKDLALLSVEDKDYVGARMSVRKKGYKQTIGVLSRDQNAWLKGRFTNGKYILESQKASWQGKVWFIPSLKAAGPTSEALRKAITIQFGL